MLPRLCLALLDPSIVFTHEQTTREVRLVRVSIDKNRLDTNCTGLIRSIVLALASL